MNDAIVSAISGAIDRLGCRRQILKRWGVPGYVPTYNEDGLFTNHNCDFIRDEKFRAAYDKGFSTGSTQDWHIRWRIHLMLWAAATVKSLPGDFIECGTYLGASASAIIDYTDFGRLGKSFFLCDTFTGLPAHAEVGHDYKKKDYYDDVAGTFSSFPSVKLVKGLIPESLKSVHLSSLSLVHIDCGMLEAEAPALRYLWDYIVKGGIVILNYYAYPGFTHIKNEYDKFSRERDVPIFSCPTRQGLIVKE
ncbi:MAG: TylF/MycF/NovP-related O-methyltransferase [Syntrophales bacterium]